MLVEELIKAMDEDKENLSVQSEEKVILHYCQKSMPLGGLLKKKKRMFMC